MVVGKHRLGKTSSWVQLRLRIAGAVLLAVSASIHLDLYLTGYRSIPTIGSVADAESYRPILGFQRGIGVDYQGGSSQCIGLRPGNAQVG